MLPSNTIVIKLYSDSKRCGRCEKEQPKINFTKSSRNKDGLDGTCKLCRKIINQERRSKMSIEEVEKYNTYAREYIKNYKNRKPQKKYSELSDNTKEHLKEYQKRRRAHQKTENPNLYRYIQQSRRAKYRGAKIVDLTYDEWYQILEQYNHKCAYCNIELVAPNVDHVIPITRGGNHTKDNVVPVCQICNTSKGNKTLEEWNH